MKSMKVGVSSGAGAVSASAAANSSEPSSNPAVLKTNSSRKNVRGNRIHRQWSSNQAVSAMSISKCAAEHEAGSSFVDQYERFHEAMIQLDGLENGNQNFEGGELATEETASEILSSVNSTISSEFGTPYEIIEYDFNGLGTGMGSPDSNGFYGHNSSASARYLSLSPMNARVIKQPGADPDPSEDNDQVKSMSIQFPELNLFIKDDSPAAAALRANANVHVSSVGKAARAAHLQSIRRLAKFAAGANKTGYVKGKPPRVPPASHRMDGPFGGPSSSYGLGSRSVSDDDVDYDKHQESHDEDGDSFIDDEVDSDLDSHDDDEVISTDDNNLDNDRNDEAGEDERKETKSDLPSVEDCVNEIQPSLDSPPGTNMKSSPSLTNSIINRNESKNFKMVHNEDTLDALDSNDEQHLQALSPRLGNVTGSLIMSDNVAPGTIEAGKKVLGNVDPHDLLKLQRWRKKQSGGKRSKKSYVKGKVIDGEHELYTLSIAVMIGVRQSISRTNIELNKGNGKRWVRIQDFRSTEKYEFRPRGDGQTPPHLLAHTFKFKDYSPVVFAYLRRMYGVNEFDFLLSVCGNANFIEFISNAKSGQFFFYSSDGRYMIKTMTNAESKFLRRTLPQYFKHCCENPNTMITRFFGMYRVKLYHLRRNVKFVIMNSVYYTEKNLQCFYDLKGSVLGREAKPGQAVLKDNDLRKSLPEGALAIKSDQLPGVRQQVAADCKYLQQNDIMDYSMLVGVHYKPHARTGNFKPMNQKMFKRQPKCMDNEPQDSGNSKQSTPFDASAFPSTIHTLESGTSTLVVNTELPSNANLSLNPRGSLQRPVHRRNISLQHLSFDDGLDDDESSYLMGSPSHPDHNSCGNSHASSSNEETERKKLATIEKLYWPFHLWFDIHGHRRLVPLEPPYNVLSPEDEKILQGYNLPKFAPPLSDRKDGGFDMDMTGLKSPIIINDASGSLDSLCDGKIFYMGIIDILQEYTTRKSFETTYRVMMNGKSSGVSCVPPKPYADRFVHFFEEYTQRIPQNETSKVHSTDNSSEEQDH